ncbi:MAG: pre-16S rRNA-processing nuclease YqgF [Gloeomargaritaceae cyanobacterium C42_A2020_066]|nr:pre-16S rRNA-processing nuclease YqgF [Gloeomargaritaceae cyanobacterium C42_A2020_066]
MNFLGLDPGRDKCGLAVVDDRQYILFRAVVPAADTLAQLSALVERFTPETLILGNQTTAREWLARVQTHFGGRPAVVLIDERHSTLEARQRYWQLHPPRGLQCLLPEGLRVPPVPVDDLVAVLLIERYLATRGAG